MALKIVVSKTLKFKVKGTFKDEAGNDQPFDFTLTCKRLDQDQINERVISRTDVVVREFLQGVITDWSGVLGEDGQLIPFTPEALGQLFGLPGMPMLVMRTYLAEVGAKEKN